MNVLIRELEDILRLLILKKCFEIKSVIDRNFPVVTLFIYMVQCQVCRAENP